MKVLHINCTDTGSTGKIIKEISGYLNANGDFSVLCAAKINNRAEIEAYKKYKVSSRVEQAINKRINKFIGLPYGIVSMSTFRILNVIRKENPDIIHFHSANCFTADLYVLFDYTSKHEVPVIITNHAEFYYTGSCAHAFDCNKWILGCYECPNLQTAVGASLFDTTSYAWKRMKKALHKNKYIEVVSVSPWVYERSMMSGIMEGINQRVILNGVDTSVFRRKQHNDKYDDLPQYDFYVAYITALFSDSEFDAKGGKYVIELAKKIEKDNGAIIVAGKTRIQGKLPDNIITLGLIDNQNDLAALYMKANVSIVTGRRETFSMPVAESLCCGTPVVGFCAGGPETIAIDDYTRFVEYGDVEGMYEEILKIIKEKFIPDDISKNAIPKYSSNTMTKEYMKLYNELYLAKLQNLEKRTTE